MEGDLGGLAVGADGGAGAAPAGGDLGCLAGSVLVVVDVTCLGLVSVGVKLLRRSPKRRLWNPLDGGDEEAGGSLVYPMVLIQIPMFNEKEVYKLSIGAACGLSWPSDGIIIQVLDDSTDPIIKDVADVEFTGNFAVNYDECFMTWFQKMPLDYHFKVEQEASSSAFAFFGFNGTAGVWRIEAINEAGGWNDRTVVEDMDLAVRASLKGWDFLYIGDIRVKSELPSTLAAYRRQQRRWTSGAANLFRKTALDIMRSKAESSSSSTVSSLCGKLWRGSSPSFSTAS